MNKPIRRILLIVTVFALLAAVLSASLLFPSLAVQTDSALADEYGEITVKSIAAGDIPSPNLRIPPEPGIRTLSAGPGARSNESAYHEAYNDIYYALINYRQNCDLSRYQLTKDVVSSLFSDILNHSPELFFVDGRLGIRYSKTTGIVSMVTFTYTMPADDTAAAQVLYTSELDGILSQMPDGMGEMDKALWLHDYLCTHYAYDDSLGFYDAYSFFRDKRGVCQGYTLVYMALLRSSGIHTDFASSTEMVHIWNLVQLDGHWYHVDVTWDDPVDRMSLSDIPGRAGHDNFLCSDQAIAEQGHYDWEAYACESSLYDDKLLDGINTALAWLDGDWYYADRQDGGIRKLTFPTFESSLLFNVPGVWHLWEQDVSYVHSYTNVCAYEGKLYYTTPDSVCVYDPAAGQRETAVRYEGSEGYIYALRRDGDVMCYTVSKAPSGSPITEYTYDPAPEPPITEPPITEPPFTEPPPTEPPVEYLNLNCGNDIAMALVTHTAGEEGQNLRIVMVGNLSQLSHYADPLFTVTFRKGETVAFTYTVEGETLRFYQSLNAGNVRFTAAQGYLLFGVSVDKIPPDGWTAAVITLTDRASGEILCEHPVENSLPQEY